jgi:hypothetical protein
MTFVVRCENGHEQTVTLIRPEVHADGSVSGYAGSAADFCNTCDGVIVEGFERA